MKKNILMLLLGFLTCAAVAVGVWFAVDLGKHKHDYGGWLTDNDYHWRECKNEDCDEKLIEKSAHADADNDGKCDICLIEHEHSFTERAVEPTCEGRGYRQHTCPCGYHYEDEEKDALGHDYEVVVTEPTCEERGFTTHTCNTCKDEYKDDFKDPLGHDYKDGICGICGNEHDHEWETKVTQPTCTESGVSIYSCICGFSYTGGLTEPLGHKYYLGKCERCGIEHDHDYKVIEHEPDCTVKGYTNYNCEGCGYSFNADYTDPLDHEFIDGICTRCNYCNYTVGLSYELSEDGSYYICTGIGSATETDIVFPEKYEGKPVKGIKNYAFELGDLTSVTIHAGMTEIGRSVFNICTKLQKIILLDGLTIINESAFAYCYGLTDITIPDSVTTIGGMAFFGCRALKSVNIGKGVASISNNVFGSCEVLESITVSKENTGYYSQGNCLIETDSKTLIAGCKTSVIPNEVKAIGDYAFYGHNGFTFKRIPDGVTSIGSNVFFECSGLTRIIIPQSVTSIGKYAINKCYNLAALTVAEGNQKYHSSGNCIIETQTKTLVIGCKASVIPDDGSVTAIGDYAFFYCYWLEGLIIPDKITSIGNHAFQWCSYLYTLNLPDSINFIGEYAFHGSHLRSMDIPKGVTQISEFAFANCDHLQSVTIHAGVTAIGRYAFNYCEKLTDIYYKGTIEQWKNIEKGEKWAQSSTYIVHCTDDGEEEDYSDKVTVGLEYRLSVNGSEYILSGLGKATATDIVIPPSYSGKPVTTIGRSAFSGCKNITSVTIPNKLTTISALAFENCTGLTSITIPAGVKYLDESAFFGCDNLTDLKVVNDNDTFFSKNNCIIRTQTKTLIIGCSNSVIPDDGSAVSIGNRAFGRCNNLESITIPNSITYIAGRAFYGCNNLTSLIVAEGNTAYFSSGNCIIERSTKTLIIGCNASVISGDGSVTTIGNSAFAGFDGITHLVIPEGITTIDEQAFNECVNLTSITIPRSVTLIGKHAFIFINGVPEITYNGTKDQWNAIDKQAEWDRYIEGCKIHCTDGDL